MIKICQQIRSNIQWLATVNFEDFGNLQDEEAMMDLAQAFPFPMEYACGCTQGAFVNSRYNTVIKFEIDRDEEACSTSILRYEIAKEMKVSEILLPLEYAGESEDGVPFYIQPKFSGAQCDIPGWQLNEIRHNNRQIGWELTDKVRDSCYRSRLNADWTKSAIRVYGKAFMRRFEEFTKRCKVNDLHSANVGYIGNRPVIIDYAGYNTYWNGEEENF